jgi:hypothetical protein
MVARARSARGKTARGEALSADETLAAAYLSAVEKMQGS